MFISTLQEQLKKMEDMYKKKLDDSQLLRHKFCRTAQELNDLKKICRIYEEENQKLRGKEVKSVSADVPCNNDAKIEQEYQELLKKINAMETNTIAMKDLLEVKVPTITEKAEVYNCTIEISDICTMYKNIQEILKEHNDRFTLLADMLNIQYDKNQTPIMKPVVQDEISKTSVGNNMTNPPSVNDISEQEVGTEQLESKLKSSTCLNEQLLLELNNKSKSLEECELKITQLEDEKEELKIELKKANISKEQNFKELSKIQEDLRESSKTLHMCLCELKILKEENVKSIENQVRLEELNADLKNKLNLVENELETCKRELEMALVNVKNYREKEDEALYCICEIKKELEESNKLHKEKRQKYKERVESLTSAEMSLKMKLLDQQNLEDDYSSLRLQHEQILKQLDEKDVVITNLLEKDENNETTKYLENLIEDLTQKCENTYAELDAAKKAAKSYEMTKQSLEEENAKLLDHLNAANTELQELKITQKEIENTLKNHNDVVEYERQRVEVEIEEVQLLSSYLEEQLNIAKKKYHELLPLTNNCCCKDIIDIVFWMQKQNESLKESQSKLMEKLQKKLSESRQSNDIETFTVVKDISNFILEDMAHKKDNDNMPEQLRESFEKFIEKRMVDQNSCQDNDSTKSQDACDCLLSKRNPGSCSCKKISSAKRRSIISTIIEEKEEETSDQGDTLVNKHDDVEETQANQTETKGVESIPVANIVREPSFESKSTPIMLEVTKKTSCKESYTHINDSKITVCSVCDFHDIVTPVVKSTSKAILTSDQKSSQTNAFYTTKTEVNRKASVGARSRDSLHVKNQNSCFETKYCRNLNDGHTAFPYVCLHSPTPSFFGIARSMQQCSGICTENGSNNKTSEKIKIPEVVEPKEQKQNFQNVLTSTEETSNSTTSKSSTLGNSISSVNSEPTISVHHSQQDSALSDSDISEINKNIVHEKSCGCPPQIQTPSSPKARKRVSNPSDKPKSNSRQIKNKTESTGCSSKIDDYLTKLSKMEKQVGHLRRELSNGRTNSISRNMKVQENNDSKRIYRHQFGNINDCPARNSASKDPRISRKDYRKTKTN